MENERNEILEECSECGATDCPGDCYLYGPGSTFAGGG